MSLYLINWRLLVNGRTAISLYRFTSMPQNPPINVWFSSGLCFLRLAGDFSLVASTPLLLYRLRKHGAAGVSVETQILRLIMFVTRYLDLFVYGQVVSKYNTCMKIILTVTSLHAVTSLIFSHKSYNCTKLQNGIYRLGLPLLFAMLPAPLFSYAPTFVEISWAFSIFLGIFADVPQLILLTNPENRDWMIKTYVGLLAGYRAFYIPHWVLRYLHWGVVDPVAIISGVSEAVIFAIGMVVILMSNCKRTRSMQSLEDGVPKYTSIPPSPTQDVPPFDVKARQDA